MMVAPQLPDTNMQPQQADMQPPVTSPVEESPINELLSSTNIAETLNKSEKGKETLAKIGAEVINAFQKDKESRKQWEQQIDQYLKLACQVMEQKTYPWPDASNVKFPILTTAALQFSSRAYPALVGGFDVVKAKAIGNDPEGMAAQVAQDISSHMSYQLLHEMKGWDEDMDKLCFILPILGTCFKKTYYSPELETNVSELVLPKDLVVNYWAKDLESAYRKTHILYRTPNQIKERQNKGIYLDDIDLSQGGAAGLIDNKKPLTTSTEPDRDDSTPRILLEQHTYWDLDDDDYKEPYTITVDMETNKVLRIVARFYEDGIKLEEGKVVCITPCEHFTKFGFIPNPDGGFYDLGFGLLLGGINESVNTLINQLIDSGTLNNMQAGFISKGIRIKQGETAFKPGEWKAVNNFGDDLKKGIFPLPTKEPSTTLFNLLGTLAQSGKELASIAEIFTGKMPGQNTPASTTMATIEQGLKVFTAIYKRIFRSLGEEFEKLYKLNTIYLPDQVNYTVEVAGAPENKTVKREQYNMMGTEQKGNKPFVKIIPAADPTMVSDTQRLLKSQGLMELIPMGTVNAQEATRMVLENQGQANIKQLMTLPPPQPPLEVQLLQMELQDKEKDRQLEYMKVMSESQKRQSEIVLNLAKAKQLGDEQGAIMLEAQLKKEEMQMDIQMKLIEMMFKKEEHQMDMDMKQEEHAVDMRVKEATAETDIAVNRIQGAQKIKQSEEKHQASMKQAKEKQALKPKKGE